MAKRRTGLRFEVLINGRRMCTSGMDGYGVLDVILTRVKRSPNAYPGKDKHPTKISKATWSKERLNLWVGGLDSIADEHLHWLKRNLTIGDKITVKVLPPGKVDAPQGKSRRLTARSDGTRPKGRRALHRGR
jgi:hypothetical protein